MLRSKIHPPSKFHQIKSFLTNHTRSLQQKVIGLTIVILLLSSFLLLHSVVFRQHVIDHDAVEPPTTGRSSSTFSENTRSFMTQAHQTTLQKGNENLIDLTPPLSRLTLGHAAWSVLHTLAALFPEDPSLQKQEAMKSFLVALGELYPCATCARHFRLFMAEHPFPTPLNRASLSRWLCESHNGVNRRTDKPIVDCATIGDKWPSRLDQDCGCDAEEPDTTATPTTSSSSSDSIAATPTTTIDDTTSLVSTENVPSTVDSTSSSSAAALKAKKAKRAQILAEEEHDRKLAHEEEERRKERERAAGKA